MKVLRDGKEVKNANVSYFAGGQPAHVEIDGVTYDPAAFTFEDAKTEKKTKVDTGEAMTTKDLGKKK